MQQDAALGLKELRVDGGAAANDLLMQFQADLLGVPVVRPKVLETTALGAAYLAGLATGVWESGAEIARQWKPARRFEPRMARADAESRLALWARALERSRAWEQSRLLSRAFSVAKESAMMLRMMPRHTPTMKPPSKPVEYELVELDFTTPLPPPAKDAKPAGCRARRSSRKYRSARASSALRAISSASCGPGAASPDKSAPAKNTMCWSSRTISPPAHLLARLLTLENYEVREAGNAAGILAAFQRQPLPDLVLLDIDLPDTNGFDVLRRIRGHRTLGQIPVVMLTGRSEPDDLVFGGPGEPAVGADGYTYPVLACVCSTISPTASAPC